MNIIIPMAGEGKRFREVGYNMSKPFIDVNGRAMINRVIDNLIPLNPSKFIFICRKEDKAELEELLTERPLGPEYAIVTTDGTTEGAACTVLLAKEFVNSHESLLIANSDQIVKYSIDNLKSLIKWGSTVIDGIIFTFHASHSRWSFVKVNNIGKITQVAEKKPISNIATCGIYYYSSGRDFIENAEQMIKKEIRTNNEFYLAPVYNEMIQNDSVIIPFFVEEMHGLGTPEDLNIYLKSL
jgi:dTDP-glucose pyrophosphorylase